MCACRSSTSTVLLAFTISIPFSPLVISTPSTATNVAEAIDDGCLLQLHSHSATQAITAAWTCPTCRLGASTPDAGRLYFRERTDGVGIRAVSLIHDMAVAARYGLLFGGLLVSNNDNCHGEDCHRVVLDLLGVRDEEVLVRAKQRPTFSHVYPRLHDLQSVFVNASAGEGSNILVKDRFIGNNCCGKGYIGIDKYLTPSFLQALRSQSSILLRPVRHFARGKTSVAMHVRRGDVGQPEAFVGPASTKLIHQQRWLEDEAYYELATRVRRLIPDADVHVFSTTKDGNWSSADFDGYRQRGMYVHLDEDVLDDWAHMSQADVLITGPSSFSYAPAVLNRGCIVYQPFCYEPLGAWIPSNASAAVFERRIQECRKASKASQNGVKRFLGER